MPPDLNQYRQLLGVVPGASEEEIRKAFLRKAKTVHPDVSSAPDAGDQFKQLTTARDVLLEWLKGPPASTANGMYRPAQPPVDEDTKQAHLRSFRRVREAEERRRNRRGSGRSRQAREAERRQQEFQQEMERRRAEYYLQREEEREREQARHNRERLEEERRLERERKEEKEREQEAQQRAEREAERGRLRAEREERERRAQEEQEQIEQQQRARPSADASERCAWKNCNESESLSAPTETILGLRRFCPEHLPYFTQLKHEQQRERAPRRTVDARRRSE